MQRRIIHPHLDAPKTGAAEPQNGTAAQSTLAIRPRLRVPRRNSIRPLEEHSFGYHASVVIRQSIRLLRFLIHGSFLWIFQMTRLLCFVVALLPAFVTFFLFYTVYSDRISIPYILGPAKTSRHYLDIYGSQKQASPTDKKKPVVIFLTGGAWIIGYKMWGTLMARTLVSFGILVVIPDYRNFPQTNIEGMITDADMAIQFTLNEIEKYGGDPNRIVLAGQSAGAHIGACALLRKASSQKATTTSWKCDNIKGFIAVSGPHDLVAMKDVLHKRGLDKSIVSAMFANDLPRYSPTRLLITDLTDCALVKQLRQQFPATCVIHGEADKTVPVQVSVDFYRALKNLHMDHPLELKVYPAWSHTDPILEAPFEGNHLFHRDVYDLVKRWTTAEGKDKEQLLLAFDETHPACRPICPKFLVEVARFCNPF